MRGRVSHLVTNVSCCSVAFFSRSYFCYSLDTVAQLYHKKIKIMIIIKKNSYNLMSTDIFINTTWTCMCESLTMIMQTLTDALCRFSSITWNQSLCDYLSFSFCPLYFSIQGTNRKCNTVAGSISMYNHWSQIVLKRLFSLICLVNFAI